METLRRLAMRAQGTILAVAALLAAAAPASAQDASNRAWVEVLLIDDSQDKPADPAPKQQPAQESPVPPRGNLNDQQESAPRADGVTLDPKYKGFIPVPNTPVLFKFNAKPRVDMTMDNR